MYPILKPDEIETIEQKQIKLQRLWKDRPPEGEIVRQLNKDFVVLPNVFPPRLDSVGLIQSLPDLNGKDVLDIGTGSGVIAIFAALQGAQRVIAVDINADAIRCVQSNARQYQVNEVIHPIQSDLFTKLPPNSKFDLITANLPFRNRIAPDVVAASQWDSKFKTHIRFFEQAKNYLRPNGYILMPNGNYPESIDLYSTIERAGFTTQIITKSDGVEGDRRAYYTLRITPDKY